MSAEAQKYLKAQSDFHLPNFFASSQGIGFGLAASNLDRPVHLNEWLDTSAPGIPVAIAAALRDELIRVRVTPAVSAAQLKQWKSDTRSEINHRRAISLTMHLESALSGIA